jgi:hypothetical protein
MKTKLALAIATSLSALALAAASPALAGGYWDGGGYGDDRYGSYGDDGYCPPPPPPPCDCPDRSGSGYGYDSEGFAPASLFEEGLDGGVGGGPGVETGDFGGGFVSSGPVVGVGFGFGPRDRFGRFHDRRFGFNDHQRFNAQQHVSINQHVMVQSHASQRVGFSGHAMMGGHGRW